MACLARWTRERDVECLTPQECAIAGPAVYPIKAPATAPTGPSTTAPETAPKAALPARSCAFASIAKNDAAITATTSNFFIAIPMRLSQWDDTPKMRRQKDGGRASPSGFAARSKTAQSQAARNSEREKPKLKTRGRFPGAGVSNSCDDGLMPVICPTRQCFLRHSNSAPRRAVPATRQPCRPQTRLVFARPIERWASRCTGTCGHRRC